MRVRFFNTYEPVTSLFRDAARELVARGHEVELVVSAGEYRHGRGRLEDAVPPGVVVTRVGRPGLGARGIGRLLTNTAYALGVLWRTLLRPTSDLDVVLTQPPLLHAWFALLRRLRGQRYAVQVMDVYPDVLVAAGTLPATGLGSRLLRRIGHGGLRAADGCLVIGRCMRDHLVALGVDPSRCVLLTNWADEEVVRPIPARSDGYREQLGIGDAFVVGYSGNLGASHDVGTLLEAVADLDDVVAVVIGDGPGRPAVERAAEALDNVVLLPLQPRARLAESLGLADVHLVSLRPGFLGLVVPSKAYGVLAAHRPLIFQGPAACEIARTVEDHGAGRVVPPGDAEALAAAIRELRDPHAWQRAAASAAALARGEHGAAASVSRYVTALEQLGADRA